MVVVAAVDVDVGVVGEEDRSVVSLRRKKRGRRLVVRVSAADCQTVHHRR